MATVGEKVREARLRCREKDIRKINKNIFTRQK